MQLTILFFGQLTDITGTDTILLDAVADTAGVKEVLHAKYPALANSTYAIAVNKKIVSVNTLLTPNCMVALMPPFSGG